VHGAAGGPAKKGESQYWFTRHSKSIIFLIVTLAVVGFYEAFTLPIAVFPTTNFPRIIIGVDNGVTPINQMEVTVTRPLENAVNNVPGLETVTSVTSRGTAEIDLFFDWSVNMPQTLQLVNAAIGRIQQTLPMTAQIETHRLDFASFPILGYSLTSDKVSQTQLWEVATYDLKPRLNRLPGVASIIIQGGQVPEFQITPEPAQMLKSKVGLQDILDAVNEANIIDSPGMMTFNHQLFLALVDGQVHTSDEIGDIVVKTVNGVAVRMRDVALVAPSVAPNFTRVTANGKAAVLLSVNRQPDSNTVTVADEVHKEIQDLRSTLPPGIELSIFYDQSNIVNESIASVRDAILIGLVLLAIVIWLFLRDWGTALVAGLVVPLTISVTIIVLKLVGQSFNLMTLGGLAAAVGLVIDDGIVVVENIVLHRDSGEGPLEATAKALKELTVPLIGSTLTPIVVFLPLITMTGVVGTFFSALAIAMSVSLFTSLVLALVWTTNLGTHLIRRGKEPASRIVSEETAREYESAEDAEVAETRRMMAAEEAEHTGGWFGRVIDFYERRLQWALKHPVLMGGFCVILVVVSYFSYNALGRDLLPAMDEGGFVLDYVMPAGSSLQETGRVLNHVEQILKATPEVESISMRTGLQLGLAAVTEPNTGDFAVKLKDKRSRSVYEVIEDVRAKVSSTEPELDVEFAQLLQDMIADLTNAPEPVVVKLFADDPDLLQTWAPQVADGLEHVVVNGKHPIVDVEDGIENTMSGPAVQFKIDPAAAAKAGFNVQQLTTAASAIADGEPATTPVIVNDRPYTIRVRFPQANRASAEAMANTLLVSPTGSSVTLGSVASVNQLPGETEILRENLQRNVQVTARLEGLDLGTGMTAVQQKIKDLNMPPAIRVEYGGAFKEQQKDFHDLVIVLLLALVLIFLVLLFEFRSFTAPVSILSSAVLSTSGVFFALFVTNTTFNVSSFMGLIMVLGIVAKNGILLLDANQKYLHVGFTAEEALIQAGRRRLRPIVMTAMAAVAGMLPLSLALGAGSAMLQPLAISVIGGILISMILSLIITPAVQYYLTRHRGRPAGVQTI
jgi:multidrug efflux pump subunit AcrB